MALHGASEWEDDYVVLSDVENDGNYASPVSSGGGTLRNPLFPRLSKPGNHSRSDNTINESTTSSQQHSAREHDEGGEDSELDDIEEIEYGYDNDTLLIMPSMLRDYSHHATNYHPELWRAPIPGSYSPHPTAVRCRQEGQFSREKRNLKHRVCTLGR